MGSILWLLISSNLCQLGWRISRVVALKKRWRRRRLIACSLSFAELGIQWVSSFLQMCMGSMPQTPLKEVVSGWARASVRCCITNSPICVSFNAFWPEHLNDEVLLVHDAVQDRACLGADAAQVVSLDFGITCMCKSACPIYIQEGLTVSGLPMLLPRCIAVPCAHYTSRCCPLRPQWPVLAVQSLNVDFLLQINISFFVVPNAYVLYNHCAVFAELVAVSGFIRWTCWNTVRALVALLKPQLRAHALPAAVLQLPCSKTQSALPTAMHQLVLD